MRAITLTGNQLQGGDQYLEWDGKDASGNPLTEVEGPYTYRLTYVIGGRERQDEVASRKIKEWGLIVIIEDRSSPDTTFETGIDEATIANADGTPKNFHASASVTNGEAANIPHFKVIADTGAQQWDAHVELRRDATHWHIFYTTPTPTSGLPEIKHTLDLTQTAPYVLDMADNPWDMNGQTEIQETKTTWKFRVDATGVLRDFQATYGQAP